MSRNHPTTRRLELLKRTLFNSEIPEARKRGVDPEFLKNCQRRISFIAYPNPSTYPRDSEDRKLAQDRLLKAFRLLKTLRRRVQTALAKATPPTREEIDVERFLMISHEQKAVFSNSTGYRRECLHDRLVSQDAALAALDVYKGVSTGYHAREFMSERRQAAQNRVVVRTAVGFQRGKDGFASMEDGRLVPYKLQPNQFEEGDLVEARRIRLETVAGKRRSLEEVHRWKKRRCDIENCRDDDDETQ